MWHTGGKTNQENKGKKCYVRNVESDKQASNVTQEF